jgi:hypothetical protein
LLVARDRLNDIIDVTSKPNPQCELRLPTWPNHCAPGHTTTGLLTRLRARYCDGELRGTPKIDRRLREIFQRLVWLIRPDLDRISGDPGRA